MEFQQSVGTRNLCIRNKSFLIRETPSLVLNFYLFSKTATNGLKSAFFTSGKIFIQKNCCPILTSLVSGSPLVQDGRLVGAVTHVFLNNSTKGYAVFIGTMLSETGMVKR